MSFQQIPPSNQQEPPQEQKESNHIGAVLVALAMILGYFGLRQMAGDENGVYTSASRVAGGPSDMYEQRVNQHLRSVDMKRQFEHEAMKVENHFKAPSLRNAEKEYSQHFDEWGVSLDQEERERRVYEDIDPTAHDPNYLETPHYDVQARIRENQIAEAQEKRRLALAMEIAVAKAAAEGYAIKVEAVDGSIVVTDVRKLSGGPQSAGGISSGKSVKGSVR